MAGHGGVSLGPVYNNVRRRKTVRVNDNITCGGCVSLKDRQKQMGIADDGMVRFLTDRRTNILVCRMLVLRE